MISRNSKFEVLTVLLAAVMCCTSLVACQKVSVPRVSSKYGNVDEISSKFVAHYLDTDTATYASSQSALKQDASPGLVQTMKKNGVLAKDDKTMKSKMALFAKRKSKETVVVQKVEEGEVSASGLIPVRVTGEIQKGTGSAPFNYVLGLGIRKDNNKLAVVTITKQ